MGNEGEAQAVDNIVGKSRQANTFAEDNDSGEFEPLVVENGSLRVIEVSPSGGKLTDTLHDVGDDEQRVRLLGIDDSGDLHEAQVGALDAAVDPNTHGQVTYLSRALSSQGQDELAVTQAGATGKSSVEYGLDIETDAEVSLQIDGYSTVEVRFLRASSETDVDVEESWDGENWEVVDSPGSPTTSFEQSYANATSKHVRLSVTGTGTSGDTADVIVAAVP